METSVFPRVPNGVEYIRERVTESARGIILASLSEAQNLVSPANNGSIEALIEARNCIKYAAEYLDTLIPMDGFQKGTRVQWKHGYAYAYGTVVLRVAQNGDYLITPDEGGEEFYLPSDYVFEYTP